MPHEDARLLDLALGHYSRASMLTLLRAALDSPGCARLHDHLLFAWTRALTGSSTEGHLATAGDLSGVLHAALKADPTRGITTGRVPNDPTNGVRFTLGERSYLVHPGELDHPLMVLRALRDTAEAVDEHLVDARGFGIEDVLELALLHTDHTVGHLASAWSPAPDAELVPEQITCEVTADELAAAGRISVHHLTGASFTDPDRTAAALDYLTRDTTALPLTYAPGLPLLGPTLLVRVDGRTESVPASTALEAAAAAAGDLLQAHPIPDDAQSSLRLRAVTRVARLISLQETPAEPREVCRISSPPYRLEIAIVATLADDLADLVERARTELLTAPSGAGRLVVYAGPRFLGREVVTDTVNVHVEELTEILAAAGGDLAMVAWWVLELTQHPGADAVAYYDVLDAWSTWHAQATLLPPGPPQEGVALVEPSGRDVSWERAALWAPTDALLGSAGLPPAIGWDSCRLTVAQQGEGRWAELVQDLPDRRVRACISSHPPLVILATITPGQPLLLGEAAFAGFADGIRGTLAGHLDLTRHFTLPGRRPVTVHLTETVTSPEPPVDRSAEVPADALAVRIGLDEQGARIDLDLDPVFLARFAEDGHHILGRILHHTVNQVRAAHSAGNEVTASEFSTAWDAATPVITWYGNDPFDPAPAPPHYLPSATPHVRVRALRVAAEAVRAAGVRAGTYAGPEALRPGGPAEEVLRALEEALDGQLRAHQPGLVPALARHLNAALSARHLARQEAAPALSRAESDIWEEEARRLETDGAATTTALMVLLQQAVATGPAGEQPVDLIAVADLVALAEVVLSVTLVAVPASRRLHSVTLTVDATGAFTLDGDDGHPGVAASAEETAAEHLGLDVRALREAQEQIWLDRARSSAPQPLTVQELFAARRGQRTRVEFARLAPPASSTLARADLELTRAWGCGLDALAAVLATAADWPVEADGIATVSRKGLAREAAAWSQLPETQILAAVDHLVLHTSNATGTHAHAYAEVERRIRPTTHPLIAQRDGILIAPWLVRTSQHLYAASLGDGRLPRPDTPPKAADLLDRYRQQQNNQLETDLVEAAARAGLPHRSRLEAEPAARLGLPGLPGEIDLLVADPSRGRLWVIEAKDPHRTISSHSVAQHLGRFVRYRRKLLAKAQLVSSHAAPAARACGVDTSRDWRVIPLFVTRSIDPAAFIADPEVAFTDIGRLTTLLTGGTDPDLGWNAGALT
ncbi:hypothetical protein [Streptomyces californicus]|uniref:hypothetical protein n=1 Tax=Streptomyces californicus TaxID=67351 RepID=UPI00296F7325|nr:hypothetical protein [Streptomyces californicus]MDW4912518.1 hypothetical protein [Streptomyces californicus]